MWVGMVNRTLAIVPEVLRDHLAAESLFAAHFTPLVGVIRRIVTWGKTFLKVVEMLVLVLRAYFRGQLYIFGL
jgi:hypothetical protein